MLADDDIKNWYELLRVLNISTEASSGVAGSSSDSQGSPNNLNEHDRIKILDWCKKNVKSSLADPDINLLYPLLLKYFQLNEKPSLKAVVNEKMGNTVLHEAVSSGFDVFISRALHSSEGMDKESVLSVKNKVGNTALHCSGLVGHVLCTEVLLDENANPNLFNNSGKLPIHLASIKQDINGGGTADRILCIRLLLSRTSPELLTSKDISGGSLLINLVEFNDLDIIKSVVEKNPEVLYLADSLGENALHKAIIRNANNLIDYFAQDNYLLTAITENNSTVLHLACRYADEGVIKKLMDAEPLQELLWIRDEHGTMAFEYLENKKHLSPLYLEFQDKLTMLSQQSTPNALRSGV
ncbi:ankyrin repeat domain-containing protein [Legionella quateirensis]|uniref:Ankyrin repeat protein n=1 Tax=Legionella quateirensis TaxID=45072 RepID=A0A378KXK4_9GAMM|nr:ankyrin repeat domain-containing protein [Legionella quateirensis]KTD48339.1 ankyrin repeat protein [Legionella quateirensis]STY18331.1 ankyrin repeat protein [Legionella quateirensis]